MSEVKTECSACSGTGLYSGMCEAEDAAVVCIQCDGTGCDIIRYKPFVKRRGCRGIKTVSLSRGRSIVSCGAVDKTSMTYREFENSDKFKFKG